MFRDKYDEKDLWDLYLSIKQANQGIMYTYHTGTGFIETCYAQVQDPVNTRRNRPTSSDFEELKGPAFNPEEYPFYGRFKFSVADIIVYFLELDMKNLPLYINTGEDRVKAVVTWRLKVGK